MHQYRITFEIKPSGFFGLPEEDNTIVMPSKNVHYQIYVSPYSQFVRPISLSLFRKISEQIKKQFKVEKAIIEITDNRFVLTFSERNSEIATKRSKKIVTKFLKILQVSFGNTFFYYNPIEIVEDGRTIKFIDKDETGSSLLKGSNFIAYNLEKLNEFIDTAIVHIVIEDQKCSRFREYFDRAVFLSSLFNKDEYLVEVRYENFLKTEIFLNYFKAITVILGDPSIDKDYQSRFKTFGFEQNFLEDEVEPLRVVRNKFDIAHYSLKDNDDFIEEISKNSQKARKVAADVYFKFIDYLKKTKQDLK